MSICPPRDGLVTVIARVGQSVLPARQKFEWPGDVTSHIPATLFDWDLIEVDHLAAAVRQVEQ